MKREVKADQSMIMAHRGQPHIALIVTKAQVCPCRAADIACHIIQSIERPRGHPNGAGQIEPILHHRVQHALSVHAAKRAALQNRAAFDDGIRRDSLRQRVNAGVYLFLSYMIDMSHFTSPLILIFPAACARLLG